MSRKILMVIAPDQFRDEELFEPRAAFEEEGWAVDTVSTRTGDIAGMLGATETVSKTLSEVSYLDYDAAVVVGGMGSIEFLWNNQELHHILKSVDQNQKVIAAICLSGAVLAKADLAKGKKMTVWPDDTAIQVLKDAGANYTGEPCTIDGNMVTANGPEAVKAFAEGVIERVNALVTA